VRYKRPTKLPAPEYVDALMNWTQSILDDEAVFPNTIGTSSCFPCFDAPLMKGVGVSFPRTFKDTVRTIVRRLFRVYAHIYSNHFDQICALGIEGAFYSIIVALLIPLMYVYKPILIRAIATFSFSSTRYVVPARVAKYALLTARSV
jgi:hypothetical protein